MAEVRVQARFGLAPLGDENSAVNTFHFFDAAFPGGYAAHATAALAAVRAFYETPPSGLAQSLGAQMADHVIRVYDLKAYNMADPPPRVPTTTAGLLPASLYTGARVPMEVCMVLSYQADPPVTRRRRGRIYIPGVHEGWLDPGSTVAAPLFRQVAASPTDVLAEAASDLAANASAWSVRSTAISPPQYARITNGFVDFDPDIQRRRGVRGASRLTWT